MKRLFFLGGTEFMSVLTLLFLAALIWIFFHWLRSRTANEFKLELLLRKVEYGKQIGLFAMVVGFLGQLVGLSAMFSVIAEVESIESWKVFGAIQQTLICPIYGILIYLFTWILSFAAKEVVENKLHRT